MSRAMHRSLFARIEAKRDDLVALTRDLIRFPTVNLPGEAYTPCAEYLGARLKARGFEVGYHRAEGETGDSARYPRNNVVARRDGGRDRKRTRLNSSQYGASRMPSSARQKNKTHTVTSLQ